MYTPGKVIFVDKSKNEEKNGCFCTVCSFVISSNKDIESFEKFSTCNECHMTFVEARKEEWKKGWRPDKQKIKEYILLRKSIIKN